jgi:PTS hybrid protein
MTVGLVIVSHSEKIADGIVELAAQMAGDVAIVAAGGTGDGRIGTSFEKVRDAIDRADSGAGAVVLCDLGSAVLTAETALDFLPDGVRERIWIADAPLVEGAVAASVAAQTGASLAAVLVAASSAAQAMATNSDGPSLPSPSGEVRSDGSVDSGQSVVEVDLVNREGLHARPAAAFVKLASKFEASVTVNGVDAKSLLRIMSLGLVRGDTLTLRGSGREADEAIVALRELVASGFGED